MSQKPRPYVHDLKCDHEAFVAMIRHGDRYGEMLAPGCVAMGVLPFRRPRSI